MRTVRLLTDGYEKETTKLLIRRKKIISLKEWFPNNWNLIDVLQNICQTIPTWKALTWVKINFNYENYSEIKLQWFDFL